MMKSRASAFLRVFIWFLIFSGSGPLSPGQVNSASNTNPSRATLAKALMCEGMRDAEPLNEGIVFSISLGKISCFSEFSSVPNKMDIYHNWYHRGELVTKLKLILQPPRWSTYSSIYLREADKGPWSVEITDQAGYVYGIVRFSITD